MRSEHEMMELILGTARADDRIRAVIMNGSRANPNVSNDMFQDYDIVYIVTHIESFKNDPHWIDLFGERMIMQTPDDFETAGMNDTSSFAYLMQFTDGNRIDLTLFAIDHLHNLYRDSLSVLLLDKDGIIEPFDSPSEKDYLPQTPTEKAFADCCNEFWWVSPYVAKGLWRKEILNAKFFLDTIVRKQLMKMLEWYIGIRTRNAVNPGKAGKNFQKYMEPELYGNIFGCRIHEHLEGSVQDVRFVQVRCDNSR